MESVGFLTSDGRKHLGYRISSADIGEPWEYGPSVYGYYYFEEGGDRYAPPFNDIKEAFPVTIVDFYYWDEEENDYLRLSERYETVLEERTASLFAKDLITNDKGSRIALCQMIREWLLLNAKCSKPVYIDKDFSIYSEGPIEFKSDIKEPIPEYITIKK